jgi:hypothetical protein
MKNLLLIAFLLFSFVDNSTAQSDTSDKDDENNNQVSLQGLTEAILIDGQPVLRIISRKNGSTEIKLQKRDGQDTFVFEVHKLSYKVPEGKLYVMKDRVIFDPYEKKSAYFNFAKTEIIEASVKKEGFGTATSYWAKIQIKDKDEKVTPLFNGEDFAVGNKKIVIPAVNFIVRAIQNFDNALAEFNQLTASVRPKSDEDEEEVEEETEADVSDKYDRFKDITIISTSKMLVRGKRSIRAYAEYNYAGKNQTKPEKVTLYFYVSASRPLFREDDLELNFLVDDKRVSLGKMRLAEEEKTRTLVKQTISISMPYETFEQIANGKKVEFQIGTLEYKLTDVHLEAFRKLLTYKIGETE